MYNQYNKYVNYFPLYTVTLSTGNYAFVVIIRKTGAFQRSKLLAYIKFQ